MPPGGLFEGLRAAAPCPAKWTSLQGEGRARTCSLCGLTVHDVSGLSEAEALAALGVGGKSKLYARADGSILTHDCPVGRRRRLIRLGLLVLLIAAAVAGMLNPTGPVSVKLRHLRPFDRVMRWAEPAPRRASVPTLDRAD